LEITNFHKGKVRATVSECESISNSLSIVLSVCQNWTFHSPTFSRKFHSRFTMLLWWPLCLLNWTVRKFWTTSNELFASLH
jgi:hypothetical protein